MNSAWPPKREPWAKITPEQFGVGDLDVGEDLVRAAAHVDRHAFRHRRRVRIVDVRVARRFFGWAARSRACSRGAAVVERQHEVLLRLLEPRLDQRLELLGVLLGQVLRLGAVLVDVVELPLVLVEVALAGRAARARATAFQPSSQMPRVPSIA